MDKNSTKIDELVTNKIKAIFREIEVTLPSEVEEKIAKKLSKSLYYYFERNFMPRISDMLFDVLHENRMLATYKIKFLAPFLSLFAITIFSLSVSMYLFFTGYYYIGNLLLPVSGFGVFGIIIVLFKQKVRREAFIESTFELPTGEEIQIPIEREIMEFE